MTYEYKKNELNTRVYDLEGLIYIAGSDILLGYCDEHCRYIEMLDEDEKEEVLNKYGLTEEI